MRLTAEATCLSWIPPTALEGVFEVPFGRGIAHYDKPPPDNSPDVNALLDADAIRFANQVRAWIEVLDGRIYDYGMTGGGRLGSTTVRLRKRGHTFAGVALPDLVPKPQVFADRVRFRQTCGGHTGAPVPRAISHPPFVRIAAPLAWSTIALTLYADGTSESEIADASAFPRHYLYDSAGQLTHKTALIRYKDWRYPPATSSISCPPGPCWGRTRSKTTRLQSCSTDSWSSSSMTSQRSRSDLAP